MNGGTGTRSASDTYFGTNYDTGAMRAEVRDRFPMSFGGLVSPGFRPTPADLAARRGLPQAALWRRRRSGPQPDSRAWRRMALWLGLAGRAETAALPASPSPSPSSPAQPAAGALPALRLIMAPQPEPALRMQPARPTQSLPAQSLQIEDGSAARTARGAAKGPRRLRLAGDDG